MAKVLIGCRLPGGLLLHHPDKEKRNITVRLEGPKVIGTDYVTTEVDADFWETWKRAYGVGYKPLANGSIFEASSQTEAKAKAKELKSEKTGFEPMPKNAPGIKPADKE